MLQKLRNPHVIHVDAQNCGKCLFAMVVEDVVDVGVVLVAATLNHVNVNRPNRVLSICKLIKQKVYQPGSYLSLE